MTSTRGPSRRFYVPGLRWWVVGLLTGVTVVNYLDRAALGIVAPVLQHDLAIDEEHFSRIIVAFQIAYMAQPLMGRLIDWLNLRRGLSLSIVWWSLAQMLTAFAGGWRSFAALRALLGVGEAGNFPGAAKAVSLWFAPRERTLATAIQNLGAGLGAMIAPGLVVFLIQRAGWPSAFAATGGIGLLWAVLWLSLYRSPEDHPWMSPEELARVRQGQEELAPPEQPGAEGVWRVVLGQRNFWALAVARFLSEPAWQFFTYWIPIYFATERHLDLKEIAYFVWVPFVAADLGSVFGGVLSPLFVRAGASVMTARKAAVSVCALLMVLVIFIGRAPSAAWATALFCCGAFAHQAISSTLLTLPADLFPKRAVATGSGLSGSAALAGGALFTFVVGLLVRRVGYTPAFVAMGLFDLVGACALWALLREPGREERAAGVQPGRAMSPP